MSRRVGALRAETLDLRLEPVFDIQAVPKISSAGCTSKPPRLLTSSRQISWASFADRLLPATGPVSERQYPTRIGVVELAMLSASLLISIENLKFPGEGDSAGPAMLKNDGPKGIGPVLQHRAAGGLIAADVVRLKHGILVEHWDVIQDEATEQQSKSGNPIFGDSFPK
jgi:hypothetical protein